MAEKIEAMPAKVGLHVAHLAEPQGHPQLFLLGEIFPKDGKMIQFFPCDTIPGAGLSQECPGRSSEGPFCLAGGS